MIFALRLEMDLMKGVICLESDEHARNNMRALKCLMVAVVQLSSFGIMLSNVRLFTFIMNPITWFEIDRPSAKKWRAANRTDEEMKESSAKLLPLALFHPITLAVPSLIAISCRFSISYMVCVDSMSVIFGATHMTDAMFNALVLTFIIDLNSMYWGFVSTIFSLNSMDDFTFEYREGVKEVIKEVVKRRREGNDEIDEELHAKIQGVDKESTEGEKSCMLSLIKTVPCISRVCGFRKIENFIAFFLLGAIYLQQVFTVIFAMTTNVLPMARDICTMWRWKVGHGQGASKSITSLILKFLDTITFVHMDLDQETRHFPRGSCHLSNQSDPMYGIYYRMQNSDRKHIMKGHDITFVRPSKEGSRYVITPTSLVNRDGAWGAIHFWGGACFVLGIVIASQLEAIRHVLALCFPKFCTEGTKKHHDGYAEMTTDDVGDTGMQLQNSSRECHVEPNDEFKQLKEMLERQELQMKELQEKVKTLENQQACVAPLA
jgi:hypothetical protein